MEELETRYLEVLVPPENVARTRELNPIHERQILGRTIFVFDRFDRTLLAGLGDIRTPSIADLFVATVGQNGPEQKAKP
jgi:ABC-2 type transport system ATP-binding protein